MRAFFRVVLLALMLVMVAMISALTAMRLAIHGTEVSVPRFIGMSPAEAERTAANLGLSVMVERQYYSPDIAEGKIMSQMPPPETKVRRGWQVRVAQSLGAQRVAIPDVQGESVRAANLNILRRGLEIGALAYLPTPGISFGQVMAQSPPPYAGFVAAPRINLLVSAAAPPQGYVMPSFVGQPLGSVNQTLLGAGFRIGNVSVVAADTTNPSATPPQPNPASIITAQNPPAGQKVYAGATIHFEVR